MVFKFCFCYKSIKIVLEFFLVFFVFEEEDEEEEEEEDDNEFFLVIVLRLEYIKLVSYRD